MIAAGVGCRAGCSAADILHALKLAAAACGVSCSDIQALFSADFKSSEGGLHAAATQLARPVFFLPAGTLEAHASGCLTHSPQAARRAALPSVAEAAALAGAASFGDDDRLGVDDQKVRLLGPRQVAGAATCALARREPRT
jgi:cobalt-precorrin 5A hydrolase